MITSLALSLIAIASGTLLTYTYDEGAPLASRLSSGACLGFAAMALVGFVCALLFGLNPSTIGFTAALLLLPVLLLKSRPIRNQIDQDINQALKAISRASSKPDRWAFIYFLFYAGVAIVMWLVFDRALLEKPEGIYTGVLNNYGDLPFHISVITRFAFGQNYPPEDPTFSGVRFTYPFLTDFISAVFVRCGANLRDSLFIENYLLAVAFVGVLHRWAWEMLRDRVAALLTPLLVLLNGGFGWLLLFSEASKNQDGLVGLIKHLPPSFTVIPETTWRWGNAISSLLLPQRGILLGLPLAVIVFTQWWMATYGEENTRESARRQGETIDEGGTKRKRKEKNKQDWGA